MKKICLLTLTLLFVTYAISAKSWIGVQAFTSTSRYNPALTIWGVKLEGETRTNLAGVDILGAIFPIKSSSFGLGFHVGAGEMYQVENNTTEVDLSDYPLLWRGSLTAIYHTHLGGNLSIELGMGVNAEQMHKATGSGDSEIRATLRALGLLISTNLFLPLSETFSLVGGVSATLPLYTQRKISRGEYTDKKNIDAEGVTVHAQIGISLLL